MWACNDDEAVRRDERGISNYDAAHGTRGALGWAVNEVYRLVLYVPVQRDGHKSKWDESYFCRGSHDT